MFQNFLLAVTSMWAVLACMIGIFLGSTLAVLAVEYRREKARAERVVDVGINHSVPATTWVLFLDKVFLDYVGDRDDLDETTEEYGPVLRSLEEDERIGRIRDIIAANEAKRADFDGFLRSLGDAS